jgi:predicted methyltransferase
MFTISAVRKYFAAEIEKYSEYQPRDEHGRWTSLGVTPSELINRVSKEGGFSIRIGAGVAPTKGYMVSTYKDRELIIDLKDRNQAINSIFKYLKENSSLLKKKGHFLGGWMDEGQLYLDVSRNVMSQSKAVSLAEENGQLAIWDVKNSQEIPVLKGKQ